MKHFKWFFVMFFCLFFIQPTFYAAGTTPSGESSGEPSVYESMKTGDVQQSTPSPTTSKEVAESQSPSIFPLFIKFIFSFALVIALLFWVMRYLSKRNNVLQTSGPVLPLGGKMLGNNRSVQVILVGQTIYILGVGEDVNLIRAIPQGEEYQHLLESYENQTDPGAPILFKKDSLNWKSVFGKQMSKLQNEMDEEKLR
jgi:flagellar protein FliO/FliZ